MSSFSDESGNELETATHVASTIASTNNPEPSAPELRDNLLQVYSRMISACHKRNINNVNTQEMTFPRLIAVSKTKSVECLRNAYECGGQRFFGENYTHEICEKSPALPLDVVWHFIGHLQSGKVKSLLTSCPNLACIQSVDSIKLANKLNNCLQSTPGLIERRREVFSANTQMLTSLRELVPSNLLAVLKLQNEEFSQTLPVSESETQKLLTNFFQKIEQQQQSDDIDSPAVAALKQGRLQVYIQINTSGEASKSGVNIHREHQQSEKEAFTNLDSKRS